MFLARGDNDIEEELFSGRFVIPETRADSVPGLLNLALTTDALGINNTKAYCVPARWSQRLDDPYDRQGERGWISPESGTVAIRRLGQSK